MYDNKNFSSYYQGFVRLVIKTSCELQAHTHTRSSNYVSKRFSFRFIVDQAIRII